MQIRDAAKAQDEAKRLSLRAERLGFANTLFDYDLTDFEAFLLVLTRNEPLAKS